MALLQWQFTPHQHIINFWINLFKTQNKLISYSTTYKNWAHMAHNIFTSRGKFTIHISYSSNGLMTHNIININIWNRLKQWIKTHGPHYLYHIHGKRFFQQKPVFTQNDSKAQGTSSHLQLMIQTHESIWGKLWVSWFGGPRSMFSKILAV